MLLSLLFEMVLLIIAFDVFALYLRLILGLILIPTVLWPLYDIFSFYNFLDNLMLLLLPFVTISIVAEISKSSLYNNLLGQYVQI